MNRLNVSYVLFGLAFLSWRVGLYCTSDMRKELDRVAPIRKNPGGLWDALREAFYRPHLWRDHQQLFPCSDARFWARGFYAFAVVALIIGVALLPFKILL